jgi:hypothetical protein
MRKTSNRRAGIRALALIAALAGALALTGCPDPTKPPPDTTVDALTLTALVTAPVKDAAPVTTAIDQTQYAGTIAWKLDDGTTNAPATFAASTVYKAIVTLAAKSGYTFDGVGANSFAHTGAASVVNAANSGVVTITFPATGAVDTTVDALALTALVTAPVKDAAPVTTAIDESQYAGTIAWKESDGITAAPAAFAAATVYKAIVTLTAKSGYTFTGIGADSFTYTGATAANAADSGVVTITFPQTAAASGDTIVNAGLVLDTLVTAPAKDAAPNTTAINETQYTGTIAWKESDGTANAPATFAASTVYKAIVTLAAKAGFTFTGIGANAFSYTGATTVTNAANSGVVTITFPATAAALSTDAGLTTVLGEPITAGAEAGTSTVPKTAAINVANSVATVAATDVVAATGATPLLFSNSDFSAGAITGAATLPLTVGSNSLYVKVTAADGVTILHYDVTINRPAPLYALVDQTNTNIAAKFGVSTASAAFTSLHYLISSPEGTDDFTTIIALGDYIDLPSLTIIESGTETITDMAIAANSSRLLRLIVVGINSFNGINGNSTDHVVFQFQNIPIPHSMEASDINTSGYFGSWMRTYLTGAFLTGLQAAAGLTTDMLWGPTRYVANKGQGADGTDTITDTLWLPTEWEMFGARTSSSQTYEVDAGQARLEYYAAGSGGDTSRVKYNSGNAAAYYWLATPRSDDALTFCLVQPNGTASGYLASGGNGIAPAFCVK